MREEGSRLAEVAAVVRRTAGLRYLEDAGAIDVDAFDRVARTARRLAGTAHAGIHLVERTLLRSIATTGEPLEWPADDTPCAVTIDHGASVVVRDLAADPRYAGLSWAQGPERLRFYAAAPLTTALWGPVGTVCAYDHGDQIRPRPDLAAALEDLAGIVVDLLEGHDAVLRLTTEAATDPLTGLPNRRLARDHLARRLASRDHAGTVVGFLDLDGFKRVNDAHGHQVGDHVLVEVAYRLITTTRASEFVGRIAGDEFVLVGGPGMMDPALGERITAAFAEPIDTPVGPLDVGASLGFAEATADDDADAVIARADARMYASRGSRAG